MFTILTFPRIGAAHDRVPLLARRQGADSALEVIGARAGDRCELDRVASGHERRLRHLGLDSPTLRLGLMPWSSDC